MCLAECRAREQTKPTAEIFCVEETISNMFEMVPHWPGIVEVEGNFFLTETLLTKEDLLENKGFLRLALELPPIMLPRKIII